MKLGLHALGVGMAAFLGVLGATAPADACEPVRDVSFDFQRRVPDRPIVQNDRRTELLVRAAQLESSARELDADASQRNARASQLRSTARALDEVVQASFGEAREVILARIDSLLEQAAIETGQARTLRVRATQLRSEASRLRAQAGVGNGGGGWRDRIRRSPAALDDVPAPRSSPVPITI